ncbi:MAG: glutathione synthase [Proteobacteria bacterium]|nr:glutathione synthase [Pseudomonadota bacterium]
MALRVALQMDPVGSLNPKGDSSLLIGREAQARGHALFTYTPDTLSWQNGNLTARGHALKLREGLTDFYSLGPLEKLELAQFDVVLLRQDPPFDMAYITSTHLLEQLPPSTRVFNHPGNVRDLPEKLMPLLFREFMPPTLISHDIQEIEAFRAEHGEIIIKPLYGYGGRAVLHLKKDDDNLPALLEMHAATSREPLMAQRFLPEVKTQDRRIILIDGVVKGVLGRIPAEGEIRANMRVGGSPAKAELTPRQRDICDAVGPVLRDKELLLTGLDVIGDYLTEINLTSPTGLVQTNALHGLKLEADFWNALERKL